MAKFEKGRKRPPNAGRKRGSFNKTTSVLKEAALLAAEQTGDPSKRGCDGLVGYLRFVAREYPPAFMSLLGRVLPQQVQVDTQTEITYRSVAEIERDMANRGFSIQDIAPLLIEAGSSKKDDGRDDASRNNQVDDDA
jgi:hypothetical protein